MVLKLLVLLAGSDWFGLCELVAGLELLGTGFLPELLLVGVLHGMNL